MQSGVLQDLESETKHGSEKPYWNRSLEGLDAFGRLHLDDLLLLVYPNLLSSESIYCLESDKEILCQILRFPLR